MNILLTILAAIAGIIALILVLALFVKQEYSIQREITITRPVHQVFDYIRFLKNQDFYSKWVMRDPHMQKKFTGEDGTVGFVYAWDGNKKAGKGEQEIKQILPDQMVDIEIRFIKPFSAIANTPLSVLPITENTTKVVWSTTGKMKYPMNAMLLFMNMDNTLGKDLEISLANLKHLLEK
jgi:hypothetical protein